MMTPEMIASASVKEGGDEETQLVEASSNSSLTPSLTPSSTPASTSASGPSASGSSTSGSFGSSGGVVKNQKPIMLAARALAGEMSKFGETMKEGFIAIATSLSAPEQSTSDKAYSLFQKSPLDEFMKNRLLRNALCNSSKLVLMLKAFYV
jgi:hypothetical protein